MIPLIAPKGFAEFTSEEFKRYVESLYREPERAAPPADFTVRLNKKGTPVIRINRKPKFLTPAEVELIAKEIGWRFQTLWLAVAKKKIEIRVPNAKPKR